MYVLVLYNFIIQNKTGLFLRFKPDNQIKNNRTFKKIDSGNKKNENYKETWKRI